MSATTITPEQLSEDKPTQLNSLGEAVGVFFRHMSPWLIVTTMVAAVGTRVWWGAWSWWDVAAVAAVWAWWPMQEWLAHVFILHLKPRKFFGRTFDLYVSYAHRLHHREPWVVDHVFVPTRVVLVMMVIVLPSIAAMLALILPFGVVLSGLATYAAFSVGYEWTHFLIHTGYKPKTKLFRKVWRNHRLHHFKNENYWFCVSMLRADYLMKTAPEPGEVEKSQTCRTLGEEFEREAIEAT